MRDKIMFKGPDTQISFWESEIDELDSPHDDALLIMLEVGGCELTKMLVDTGSSVELILLSVLRKMGIPDREIEGDKIALTGFSGETTLSLEMVKLYVIAAGVRRMVEFTVICRLTPIQCYPRQNLDTFDESCIIDLPPVHKIPQLKMESQQ